MFNRRTLAVVKRELRTRLLSKSFILMTTLIPVFLFGVIAVQTFIYKYEGDEKAVLHVISESEEIISDLKSAFEESDYVKSGSIKVSFNASGRELIMDYVNSIKKDLLDDKITGIVFIPKDALKDKKLEYYSKNPNNNSLFNKIRETINKVLMDEYFAGRQLSNEEILFAKKNVDFSGFRVSKEDKVEEEGVGNQIVSFLFTFLLYFSLIFIGTIIMRAVVEEKNNKIVEVLLSSLDAKELMTGKILGMSIMGVIQMTIWLLPVIVLISSTWFMLPPEFTLTISLGHVGYLLINFFIGLVTYLGLFAAVGAMFDNDQDAQSGVWPIMILIMIPFFISIAMQSNPENQIAKITSMVPFFSLIVMPARMTIIDVPAWQFILSFAVNIATMLLIFPIAGKIYRVGILRTGKKPSLGEIIMWLKYKY
jgi:ABC-2 type transport system permease protein